MEQINKVELCGNIGNVRVQEIEGKSVANFSLATNLLYNSKDGTAVSETTWHNIVAWTGMGMPDFKLLERGKTVHVIGRLRVRKYTGNDGNERQITEVTASWMEIVEKQNIQGITEPNH